MTPAAEDALLVKAGIVAGACAVCAAAVTYALVRAVVDQVWPFGGKR